MTKKNCDNCGACAANSAAADVHVDSKSSCKEESLGYGFYSNVLKKPFERLDDLKKAEYVYYEEQKAKEGKAAQKKADAQKVEDAFKALNAARKSYKEELTAVTQEYSEHLAALKKNFEDAKKEVQDTLAAAEEAYSAALKEFTNKYPEGYHLTLKDGDFETTISSNATTNKSTIDYSLIADIFEHMFRTY